MRPGPPPVFGAAEMAPTDEDAGVVRCSDDPLEDKSPKVFFLNGRETYFRQVRQVGPWHDGRFGMTFKRWVSLALVMLSGCHSATSRWGVSERHESCRSHRSVLIVDDAARIQVRRQVGLLFPDGAEADQVVLVADNGANPGLEVPPDVKEQSKSVRRLTLQDATATALSQNPDLAAIRGQENVSVAALGVAETYPWNPQYQTQTTPWVRDREGNDLAVNNQHAILQTFELGHQQGHRVGASASALNQVRWSIRQAELTTAVNTARLFFTALYLRDVRQLSEDVVSMNAELEGVVTRQFEAGQATKADVAQIRLDGRSARRQRELAEANYQTALLDLQRQLNLTPDTKLEIVDDLASFRWNSIEEAVGENMRVRLAELVSGRPDILAARADVDTGRANLGLAEASRVPNVQLGPFYERDESGTQFAGFKGAVDIPVVNTGMPLVRQRSSELRQRMNTVQQLTAKATIDAEAAIRRYERARRIVDTASADFAEPLPKELREIKDQFALGQVDILRVFAARSSLIQDRRAFLDSLNELAQAAVGISAATALPPSSLLTPRVPEQPVDTPVPTTPP